MTRDAAMHAFLAQTPWADAQLHPLKGDASFRRYTRLARGAETAMLMDAPPPKEDVRPYLAVARHLRARGYSAPDILAEDADQGFLLLEDLGDDLFTGVLAGRRILDKPVSERDLYLRAVDLLAAWRRDPHMARPRAQLTLPDYSETLLLQEAALLCDWFLPQALGDTRAQALREEYLALWRAILNAHPVTGDLLVHRDYHADNLLWLPRRTAHAGVGLLDFQDAVWGHPAYDLASLLEDARRDVGGDTVHACIERYLAQTHADADAFMTAYAVLAAQRNCKIIGIFVRLAVRDGKHGYLHYLPRVWRHLQYDLEHPALARLRAWVDRQIPEAARGVLELAA
jgi:aminoglycoside/choline kinase family phosphotransferase